MDARPGDRVNIEFVVVAANEGGAITLEVAEPERIGYPLQFSTLPDQPEPVQPGAAK